MKKKLLFVEDDTITGTVYKFHFSSAGYKTELAGDGEAALAALERFKPDVVVLDLLLPKINGVEVLKHIRSQPGTAALPVVVFSNVYASELGKQAEEAGANLCLNKAKTNYTRLLEAVRGVLEADAPERSALKAGTGSDPPEASGSQTKTEAALNPRDEFRQRTPQTLANARRSAQNLLNPKNAADQAGTILELKNSVHLLTALAALCEAHLLAQLASALEVLLKDLHVQPRQITPSTLRTINQTLELLGVLFDRAAATRPEEPTLPNIMVVDDDSVSRKLISVALEIAQLKSVSLDDPNEAHRRLQKEPFGLLITDVRMPGMSGFELCEKVRALPGRSQTPVILVTAADDFTSRVHSARSGADDFIAKPFLSIELAVKALNQLLRSGSPNAAPSFQPFHPES